MTNISDRVSLLEATSIDIDRLAEVSSLAFDADVNASVLCEVKNPNNVEHEWHAHALKTLDYYCILLDDSIIGGFIVSSGEEKLKTMRRVFLDPNYRNKGIIAKTIDLASIQYPEVKVWTVGIPDWNNKKAGFFEELGFIQIGWDNSENEFRARWYQKIIDSNYRLPKVEDLREGMSNVTVEGEILEKSYARQVRSRRRHWETLRVADAGFGDETGRLVLTLWNEQIKRVKVGDHIRVENGYVGSYRGVKQLSMGKVGKIIHLI